MTFPSNFVWGCASSAYQVEGAHNRDGKGPSIWDEFTSKPGHIAFNSTGNTSCCHYDLYEEDIKLMAKLGIKSYRFSISWPRVFPNGDSKLNKKGLEFYDNLVNCCIENNIVPYITLFHWDLPLALEKEGGWLSRSTARAFAEYAAFICEHFSDRVDTFITINEPQIISMLGYYQGVHAPGLKLSIKETFHVIYNLALAHGLSVATMRKSSVRPVKIGFSSTGNMCFPANDCEDDINAAKKMSFITTYDSWSFCHHIFCDMTLLGQFPKPNDDRLMSEFFKDSDFVNEDDLTLIHQPVDFLGINIYNGHEVNSLGNVPKIPGSPRTSLKWPITPRVMNYGLKFLYERYKLPIYITENGLACNDIVFLDGKVHDPARIDFLTRYMSEMYKAIEDGVPILGYFHWSFTDNFEWHSGYEERFGLVYVDYATQKRIPKDSAYWYQNICETNQLIY